MNAQAPQPSTSDRALGALLLFAMAVFAWFLATWGLLGGSSDSGESSDSVLTDVGRWIAIGWPILAAVLVAVAFLRRWARGASVGWVPLVGSAVAFAGWLVGVALAALGS